jgi:ankyrin repeat protein
MELGAPGDPLLAYDIGGVDGLAAHPGPIDAAVGPTGETVLHEAVRRRDGALLRAALDRGADRGARDASFRATPLQWAQHLGNAEAAALLSR